MSDHLMQGIQVKLTTTMDSILKTAVFEVMSIFENALYDHKMEMAQKGEEIAQLKVKLQTAELRLKDYELSDQRGAEKKTTQTEPEVAPDAPEESTSIPEVDVEVPDDWCAPLGDDTATRPEEGFCPSVRLRQFSIPLYPVSLLKHEHLEYVRHGAKVNLGEKVDIGAKDLQRRPGVRGSTRISTLNKKQMPTRATELTVCNQKTRRPKLSGDINKLITGLNQNYCNLNNLSRLRRRKSEGCFVDEEQQAKEGKGKKAKEEEGKKAKEDKEDFTEPKNNELNSSKAVILLAMGIQNTAAFSCGRCSMSFPTKSSLLVHMHSQLKCSGCEMVFCYQNALNYHLQFCDKHQALIRRKPKQDGKMLAGEGNALESSKMKVVVKEEMSQFSSDYRTTSAKAISCKHCGFKTRSGKKWKRHKESPCGKLLTCTVCSRKFVNRRALKIHMTKIHREITDPNNIKGDLGWTKPLDEVDEDRGIEQTQ